MKFQSLGTAKVSKEDTVAAVIVTPTNGNMRLTPKAVEQLGLSIGDCVAIVRDEEGNPYIGKVSEDYPGASRVNDPAGKKGTGIRLGFSAASAYNLLGGDPNFSSRYVMDEEGNTDDESNTTFYSLTFAEKAAKTERKKVEAEA